MFSIYKIILSYFFYTPSAVQAEQYASQNKIKFSLTRKLTHPLRILYYAIVFQFALRLSLYSIYQDRYTYFDPTMALLDSATTHHMIGLTLVPFGVLGFYLDYLLLVVPSNDRVASLMRDTLVYNKGNVLRIYLKL